MSQCMHDGRSGPCERLAAPAEFFCKRHLPKAKKRPYVLCVFCGPPGCDGTCPAATAKAARS